MAKPTIVDTTGLYHETGAWKREVISIKSGPDSNPSTLSAKKKKKRKF